MIGFSFTVDVASFFAILFYCRIEDLRTLADPIAQQGFVNGRRVGELTRAAAGLPATNAQFCRWQWPKPMQVVPHIVAEPLQRLALPTSRLSLADEGRHQFHVGAHLCRLDFNEQ